MIPSNDPNGIANSEDHDQTDSLVCTVCPTCLSENVGSLLYCISVNVEFRFLQIVKQSPFRKITVQAEGIH